MAAKVNGNNQVTRVVDEDENGSPGMRTAETLLRLLPVGLCVASLVLMLKDNKDGDYGSFSYSTFGAFKYLVHANGICAGYSFLSAAVLAIPRPFTLSKAWTFFILDQLLTYIILAAGAVATEIMYLAYRGDDETTWNEGCSYLGGFCHKARASIIITFVAVICYAGLCLLSSYRLFSKFDAPPISYSAKGTHSALHG